MFLLFLSFMLGLSLLLPWNSLLKSMPYIMTRVPEEWKDSAPLWLTLTFTLTNCVVLTLLTLSDADSRLIRKLTGWRETEKVVGGRLYGGLMGCAGLLGLACVGPLMDIFGKSVDEESMSTLILFWGIFICTGWLMCLLQRSVYPLMALIPGKKDLMVPAMLTGQAVAGIAASMGSFLFAGEGKGGAVMALAYFGCSILALLVTAVLYSRYASTADVVAESESNKVIEEQPKFSIKILYETAKIIRPWPQLLSFNFAATLAVFPGLLTSSARSLAGNKFFIPMTFLVFDAFDLIGKVMPSVVSRGLGPKSKIAMGFPLMRVLFIPAFLILPNFGMVESGLTGDWWYFSVLAMMAWTSGWGNAICLINGPLSAQNQNKETITVSEEMGDRIGSLMGLSITFGLLCGSGVSFLIKKLIN